MQVIRRQEYVLLEDEDFFSVVAFSAQRIAYPLRGWQKEFRRELREAIGRLQIPFRWGGEQTLVAGYGGGKPDGFYDVENVLFYNLGAAPFAHLAGEELCFSVLNAAQVKELRRRALEYEGVDTAAFAHVYEYAFHPFSVEFHQRTVPVLWRKIPIRPLHGEHKPLEYWRAMRENPGLVMVRRDAPLLGSFQLQLVLTVPKGTRLSLPAVMKPLLDGVICAFHHLPPQPPGWCEEMGGLLGCEPALLLDRRACVLGEEQYVGKWWGKRIKWNPQDHRCTHVDILLRYHDKDEWHMGGSICPLPEEKITE